MVTVSWAAAAHYSQTANIHQWPGGNRAHFSWGTGPRAFLSTSHTRHLRSCTAHIDMAVRTELCLSYQVKTVLSLRLFLIFWLFFKAWERMRCEFPIWVSRKAAANIISAQLIAHRMTCKLVCKFCHKLLTSSCNVLAEKKPYLHNSSSR